MGMVVWFGGLVGGAVFAGVLAREHGGRKDLWVAVTLGAGLIGYALAAVINLAFSAAAAEKLGLLAIITGPALSIGAQAITLFILHETAQGDPKLKAEIPAYCLSRSEQQGFSCRVRLLDGQLLLESNESGTPDRAIPWGAIGGASVDGECLRLQLDDGPLVLQPGDPELVSSARRRVSRSLCAAIERRRGGSSVTRR